MYKWAFILAIVALIAAVLGFGGIAGTLADIALVIFRDRPHRYDRAVRSRLESGQGPVAAPVRHRQRPIIPGCHCFRPGSYQAVKMEAGRPRYGRAALHSANRGRNYRWPVTRRDRANLPPGRRLRPSHRLRRPAVLLPPRLLGASARSACSSMMSS